MRYLGLSVVLSLSALSAPAFAEDLVFDLINNSSINLQELYVSPAETNTWRRYSGRRNSGRGRNRHRDHH